jgi:inorganic pyrophosphatase
MQPWHDVALGRELAPHRVAEVRRFFEGYKALENKTVIVDEFLDREEAVAVILDAMAMYSKHRDELRAGKRP